MNSLIDLEYLHEISDGDNEFLRDLLESFINQTPVMIAEVEELLKKDDWEEVAKRAHKLRPTFEYVGLTQVSKKMEFVENTIRTGGDLNLVKSAFEEVQPDMKQAVKEIEAVLATL